MNLWHWAVTGPSGVGKSMFLVWKILRLVEQRISCTVVFPHDPPALALAEAMYARFKKSVPKRLIYEVVGDMDRVLMRSMILYSTATNYYDRERDDRLYEERAIEPLMARQTEGKLSDTPMKERHVRLKIRFFQEAKRNGARISDCDVIHLLKPKHPVHKIALAHCKNPELLWEIEDVQDMPSRDYFTQVESANRYFEPIYGSPDIKARTSKLPSFDLLDFFHRGGVHLITQGKSADSEFRTLVHADFLQKFKWAMDDRMPSSGHVYLIDEANNKGGLFNRFCGEAQSTSRFKNFWVCPCSQFLNYDEETLNSIKSNCSWVVFRQSDPELCDFFASMFRGAMDRNKIHHTDYTCRKEHDGFDEIKRSTKSTSDGPNGKSKGESSTTQLVARYKETTEVRHTYESGRDQEFWQSADIRKTPRRACWIIHGEENPYLFQVPQVGPWFNAFNRQEKIRECLALLKAHPALEAPLPPAQVETTISSDGNGTNGSSNSHASNGRSRRGKQSKQGSGMRIVHAGGSNGAKRNGSLGS